MVDELLAGTGFQRCSLLLQYTRPLQFEGVLEAEVVLEVDVAGGPAFVADGWD
jgi:hypothetical protein